MNNHSRLFIATLVLLLLLPVPVFAGDISGAYSVEPDQGIHASYISPATVQPTLVRNARVVLITTVTPQATGGLILESVPSGASVTVDGILIGTTPVRVPSISPGVHSVAFALAGYQDYQTKVTVPAGAVITSTGTLTPAITETVTRAVYVPVTITTQTIITEDLTTTVKPVPTNLQVTRNILTSFPTASQVTRQPTSPQVSTCTRHYFGNGEMSTSPDGRLTCTILISTDDQAATLSIPAGTIVADAGRNPVPDIRVTSVVSGEILPDAVKDGRWTGRAYHFLPEQTSFDPPAFVSFTLTPDEWDRMDPSHLTIRETSGNGTGWETLPTDMDPVTRTLQAPVRHFSIIGLFSTSPVSAPETPQSPVDLIRTATGSGRGSLPLSTVIPDKYAPLAAVVAGIALSVAGTMAGAGTAVSRLWDKIIEFFKKFLISETAGLLNTTEIEKRGLRPAENLSAVFFGFSSREMLVMVLSALGFAAAFLLQDQTGLALSTILIFVCTGGVATILHDLAHRYGAYRCGCVTEYRFWGFGTFTMLFTAWLFGNAFAKPSRTLVHSGDPLVPEKAAIIKLAGPLMSMALAILSLFLIPLGGLFVIAGSAGFTMNLLNSVFSLVPVRPNDGVEVYAWNKGVWAAVFIPLIAFYLYVYLLV